MLFAVHAIRSALAILALVAVACGGGGEVTQTPAPTSDVLRTPVPGPSQSVADARRDGVPPPVAELPFATRVADRARIRTPEGVWLISRPSVGDEIEAEDYEEILLLDTDETQILRAFPLASVGPKWITVADDAIYCGRRGGGRTRYSMVCRIDRESFASKVRVYTDRLDTWIPGDHPTSWEVEGFYLDMRDLVIDDVALWVKTREEGWTRIDPATLTIVERGTAGPAGPPAPRVTAEPS